MTKTKKSEGETLATALAMLAVLVILALGVARCVGAAPLETRAVAQDRGTSRSEQAVVLGRYCVKEATWSTGADCTIIGQVLMRVGRGDVIAGARINGHGKIFDPARLGDRPWIAGLTRDGAEPALWPARLQWSGYRDRWLARVEEAAAIVRDIGPDDPICYGKQTTKEPRPGFDLRPDPVTGDRIRSPAMQWGGLMDHERARRFGWITLDCGPSPPMGRSPRGNLGYARPRGVRAVDARGAGA